MRVVALIASASTPAAPLGKPKRGAGLLGLAMTLAIVIGAALVMRRARRLIE